MKPLPDTDYFALAYYLFVPVEDPVHEMKNHKRFFKDRDVTGRIYIGHEGINGQMSGSREDAMAYMEWIESTPFAGVEFKVHGVKENIFPRMVVKVRDQIVALDAPAEMEKTGKHLAPKDWKETLESDEDYLLIDVRNDYEWEVGHFEGAELPACGTFREFRAYAEELEKRVDPENKKILMYCTGGIRCEIFSAYLNEKGFKNVFQLDGGVIKYGLEEEGKHWNGKLFVFDDRLTVPVGEKAGGPIGQCQHCKKEWEGFVNCANVDCNRLFICCPECLKSQKGCCQTSCQEGERVRKLDEKEPYKPFRRLSTGLSPLAEAAVAADPDQV